MNVARVGVVGAGLVAQIVHIPELQALREKFVVTALADPNQGLRDLVGRRFAIPNTYHDWRELLDSSQVDIVAICSPTATHADILREAIKRGLPCFVEKPICISPRDAGEILLEAASRKVHIQIGYMKQFDPAYQAFLNDLEATSGALLHASCVTYDPGLPRFFGTNEYIVKTPRSAIARGPLVRDESRQVNEAIGSTLTTEETRSFVDIYLGALIHDINLMQGAFRKLKLGGSSALSSARWNGGKAVTGASRLPSGATWSTTWLLTPRTDKFLEELTFYFEDCTRRLEFEPPYGSIKRRGTRYIVTDRKGALTNEFRDSSFLREWEAFHDALLGQSHEAQRATGGTDDVRILCDLFRLSM